MQQNLTKPDHWEHTSWHMQLQINGHQGLMFGLASSYCPLQHPLLGVWVQVLGQPCGPGCVHGVLGLSLWAEGGGSLRPPGWTRPPSPQKGSNDGNPPKPTRATTTSTLSSRCTGPTLSLPERPPSGRLRPLAGCRAEGRPSLPKQPWPLGPL